MDRPWPQSPHRSSKREPLSDASNRANLQPTPPRRPSRSTKSQPLNSSTASSEPRIPHHESVAVRGQLAVRNAPSSAGDKRISAISSEGNRDDSRRSSQVSTASTNASIQGRKRKTHIGPWQLGGDLGKGGCGKVRKCRHALTGQQAAVKIIEKKTADFARAESLMSLAESARQPGGLLGSENVHVMPFGVEREVVIMKLLEHENVVKLYDVWENRNELYLVMERVDGGELFEFIDTAGWLAEDETVWLLRQIIAALLHCHRLGIHHRDLKPENILLDRSDSPKVKLVDFGMAALQPQGKLLTTPCGSIHYAAPEVFEKSYDGNKIDVWSLGVILFVMLCGHTPFQYDPVTMENDTQRWYTLIKTEAPEIPDALSPEAKDLIRKMLVANPKERISLEACWHHPLIQNYCRLWEPHNRHAGNLDRWIGATPVIGSWDIKRVEDIDRDILRNLRTLWHSEKEQTLIARLLSNSANHEKYFYVALQRHREEQLENYMGLPEGFAYSASDYHHIKTRRQAALPPIPPSAYRRSKSSFSILKEPSHTLLPKSKSSFADPPASEQSYDPYRASRDPIISSKNQYNVTVLRGTSKNSRQRSTTAHTSKATTQRMDAMPSERRNRFVASSAASHCGSSPTRRPMSSRSKISVSKSKSSLGSSVYTSNPVVMVPSASHKRAVNFSHSRRTSHSSQSVSKTQSTSKPSAAKVSECIAELRPSPAGVAQTVKSKKEAVKVAPTTTGASPHDKSCTSIDYEARKVSTELGKFCEEAFFRTSIGSGSTCTSAAPSHELCDSPPSSVSQRGSGHSTFAMMTPTQKHDMFAATNLTPGTPGETPHTFMARELAETRRRLADRYAQDNEARNSTYDEVLAHLDELLHQGNALKSSAKQVVSASDQPASTRLSSISEEKKSPKNDGKQEPLSRSRYHRAASTQDQAAKIKQASKIDPSTTIRLIDEGPTPRIAPLVIRKARNSTSPPEDPSPVDHEEQTALHAVNTASTSGATEKLDSKKHDSLIGVGTREDKSGEIPQTADVKRKGWFFGWKKPAVRQELSPAPPKRWEDLDDRQHRPRHTTAAYVHHTPFSESMSSVSTTSSPVVPNKRPGFLAFLKRRKPERSSYFLGTDEDDGQNGNATARVPNPKARYGPRSTAMGSKELGVQQNWLARVLHVKPLSRILCFDRGVGHARTEIVRLLKGWKTYGMRDVRFDRSKNVIWGRLTADNYLGIKEVSFVVQLFVVLREDRRAKLSIARFTQTKGAASSFRKIVDHVETVLDGRDLLVNDSKTRQDMTALLLD